MEKYFKSTRHPLFFLIFIGLPLLALLNAIYEIVQLAGSKNAGVEEWLASLAMLAIILFFGRGFFHCFLNTGYHINDQYLCYRSLFNSGCIPLEKIQSVRQATYPPIGSRPAMDLNGLEIRYESGRKIFISPESRGVFIATLSEKNPNIKI